MTFCVGTKNDVPENPAVPGPARALWGARLEQIRMTELPAQGALSSGRMLKPNSTADLSS
jgi:hypothetical protein